MRMLALLSVSALGGALILNAADTALSPSAEAQDQSAASIIAIQIRKQGFACKDAQGANRDPAASKPDLPVWILDCGNATYRVQLVPNMAAKVELID